MGLRQILVWHGLKKLPEAYDPGREEDLIVTRLLEYYELQRFAGHVNFKLRLSLKSPQDRVVDGFSTQLFKYERSNMAKGFSAAGAKKENLSLSFPCTIQQRRVMDLRLVKTKQEPDQDNHFTRIPEDLLVFILNKIDDLRYLCWCSLLSKRFYSTIHLIRTVSVTLPFNETPSTESASEIKALFYKISESSIEEINQFILSSSSLKWLKFLLSLQKFRQLKSISLNFTCPADLCSSSLFNMNLRISGSETKHERRILIIPSRVYKLSENGNHFEHMVTFCGAQVAVGCCAKWLLVLFLLLKCLPSLESVVITNLNKPWTLVVKDSVLVAFRNNLVTNLGNITLEKKSGVIRELLLPVSGYVMKEVRFTIEDLKFPGSSLESMSDDALSWEFVGDKNTINEAFHAILAKLGVLM